MKKEQVGWIAAGLLLLILTVVTTLLLARGCAEPPKPPIGSSQTPSEAPNSNAPTDNQRAVHANEGLDRAIDSVQAKITAAFAEMNELFGNAQQGEGVDGSGGPGEEGGVMPDYHLSNATEHLRLARAAGTLEARAAAVRAARQDLISARECLIESRIEMTTGAKVTATIDQDDKVDVSGLPAALRYPDAKATGRESVTSDEETFATYSFTSPDKKQAVVGYYRKALSIWVKAAEVEESDGNTTLVFVSPDQKQSATLTIGSEGRKTTLSIFYVEKR